MGMFASLLLFFKYVIEVFLRDFESEGSGHFLFKSPTLRIIEGFHPFYGERQTHHKLTHTQRSCILHTLNYGYHGGSWWLISCCFMLCRRLKGLSYKLQIIFKRFLIKTVFWRTRSVVTDKPMLDTLIEQPRAPPLMDNRVW